MRTRRPGAPSQSLPGVLREPGSPAREGRRGLLRGPLCGAPCKPLIAGACARTPPHPPPAAPPPPLAGIPATCSRDGPRSRGRVTRRQEQPLGGARAPRPLARFSSIAPGPGLDAACSSCKRRSLNQMVLWVVDESFRKLQGDGAFALESQPLTKAASSLPQAT